MVEQKYGVDYVNAGIEGYGWGALSVFLVIRHILGLKEEEAGMLTVAPVLPQALRRSGAFYKLGPLPWGKQMLNVECVVKDAQAYTMRIECSTRRWEWEGTWGEERRIVLL